MATRNITTRIAIDGEAQCRNALKNINSEYATLKSELALVKSQFAGNANSMEALKAKGDALNKMLDSQKQKVSTLQNALNHAREAQEAHAKSNQDANAALAENKKAIEALDEATLSAGQKWAKYAAQIEEAERELKKCEKSTEDTAEAEKELQARIVELSTKMAKLEDVTDGGAASAGKLLLENQKLNAQIDESQAKYEAATRGVNSWQKQLNSAQAHLNDLKREIAENNRYLEEAKQSADGCASSIDRFGKEAKQTANEVDDVGEASKDAADGAEILAAGLTALIAAATACVESSRGYRTEMAKLDTAFQDNKFSANAARETYRDLVGILGETDQAVEAANHLALLTDTEQELATWTGDILPGVFAKLGASLPLENLTEAANETAKVGTVTGGLADALNWAGISEDEFNKKLAACTSEQERQTLIMETLASVYSDASAQYRATNADIIEANRVTDDWNAKMAEAGEAIEPMVTDLKELGISLLDGAIPAMDNLSDKLPEIVSLIGGISAALITYKAAMAAIELAAKAAAVAHGELNIALLSNPWAALATAIAGVVAAIAVYQATNERVTGDVKELAQATKELADSYSSTIDSLTKVSGTSRVYLQQLSDLAGNTNRSSSEQALLLEYVGLLNEAIPGMGLAWDETTNSLNMSIETISAMIDKEEGVGKLTAATEALAEAQAAQADIEARLAAAEEELVAAQEASLAAAEADMFTRNEATDRLLDARAAVDELKAAYEDNARVLEESQATVEQYSEAISQSADTVENEAIPATEAEAEELEKLAEEYYKTRDAALNSIAQQIDSWREMDVEAKTSVQDIIDAQSAQYTFAINYTKNMEALLGRNVRGVELLAQKYADGSEESAAALAGLAEASDRELTELIERVQLTGATTEELAECLADVQMGVSDSFTGMSDSAGESTSKSLESISDFANETEENVGKIVQTLSEVEEGTESWVGAFKKMQADTAREMQKTAETVARKKAEIVAAMGNYSGFYSVGSNDAEGYRRGLLSKLSAIRSAASSLSNASMSSMKKTSRQSSPSKAYQEIADFDAQGYLKGWALKRQKIIDEIRSQGETNLKAMQVRTPTGSAVDAGFRAAETAQLEAVRSGVSAGTGDITALLQAFGGKLDSLNSGELPVYQIYFDDGTWAGRLAPAMDEELGELNRMKERGG